MRLCGTGIVCAYGRGRAALEAALSAEVSPPSAFTILPDVLKDRAVLGTMRRADRFSKMATLAAYDAVAQSGSPLDNPERVGIVLATAFGPHNTTFGFLDEILTYGDAAVSPTVFSNSVHNAAVSYISNTLKIKGPTWTITCFDRPVQQALQVAQVWLAEGRCDQVLVGAVDESGPVLDYICAQKLEMASTPAQMRPFFDPAGPAVMPGELAIFFLLARDPSGGVQIELRTNCSPPPDLWMVDFESPRPVLLSEAVPTGCWSHRIGATPISTAFSCAAAGLMLKQQTVCSATDWFHGSRGINDRLSAMGPSRIACGETINLYLTEGVL